MKTTSCFTEEFLVFLQCTSEGRLLSSFSPLDLSFQKFALSHVWVLGVEGEQIGSIVVFLDVTSFTAFGLPSTIEGEAGGQEA